VTASVRRPRRGGASETGSVPRSKSRHFSANPSHRGLPVLRRLHGFPADRLPILLSMSVFYCLVFFSVFHFLVVGSVR